MEYAIGFVAVAGVYVAMNLYSKFAEHRETLVRLDVQVMDLQREIQVMKEDLRPVIREEIEHSNFGEGF